MSYILGALIRSSISPFVQPKVIREARVQPGPS
jgi:hypothetical protein